MLFSIIIPVYNRAKTLPTCLDSVISQDFDDFECILVNDGSSDNSLSICKEYSLKDSRFKVFEKPNGGVGSARNLGLEKAKGDWIVFVDSDDRILSNHLSQFKESFESKQGIDVVFCGLQYEGGPEHPSHIYETKAYVGKEQVKHLFSETDVLQYMCACDRTYRKSLLDRHSIRFDTSLPISEDRLFCYEVLKYVQGVATTSYASYVINESDHNSLSRRPLSSTVCLNRYCKLFIGMKELIEAYNIYDDRILPFWIYNFGLLKNALFSLYDVKGNIFKAAWNQNTFMKEHFDYGFYNRISTIPSVKKFMSNKQAQRIINSQFYKLDLQTLCSFILYKLHIKR